MSSTLFKRSFPIGETGEKEKGEKGEKGETISSQQDSFLSLANPKLRGGCPKPGLLPLADSQSIEAGSTSTVTRMSEGPILAL